ncbi:dihydrodipicolinate synthase family protein [Salmonella enterica]|nr:dihydrodipicolinate synthase family protein [Salmonella enterica]EJX4476276.1 dihydrodipicolinate synthase family protein [Salmonella enterica]EKS4544757.1 dihydrodipicolinate synthase family protein [Salmonella enterica]EKS4549535.1 dihydrodipicolinate synthase family protein [Salmonella enterica]EKS4822637.1 dihydrodipicolinate synthase family protein [Salmonella enterica]
MKKLYGITTAMITPFNDDDSINYQSIEALTDFLVAKGVHCLYPLGTTGEMFHLSEQERKKVAETVIKRNNHRATVYIHVGAMTTAETLSLARHAVEAGADGIGVVTPAFFGASDRELEAWFVAVANTVPDDFPVYLYNIPQCAANNLSADVAQRIADKCKYAVGIKYSYPDYLTVNQYLAIKDYDFSVMVGADRLCLPALAMGCDGVVSGVSCVYPEPFIKIYDTFNCGDIAGSRAAQRQANKYCELLRNGSNMSYFKEGLKYRGINAGVMRAPQLNITPEEVKSLIAGLAELETSAPI